MSKSGIFYNCIPCLNKECKKENCYMNGGECRLTVVKEYSQEGLKEEIERLNNKEEQLIRRLEDLIIVGEQVENEWAVDICKMIIKELKEK